MEEKIISERLSDYDSKMFLMHRNRNGADSSALIDEVRAVIAKHNLSVTVARGFLEYMKVVIDNCSYLPKEK